MSLIQIFTLGFRPQYLMVGYIVGFIIGIYFFFRLGRLFPHFNVSKKTSLILRIIITVLIIISCFNIQSLVTLLLAYLFFASVLADIIRIALSLLASEKHSDKIKPITALHSKGLLALIIFMLILVGGVYGLSQIEQTDYYITTNKTNESYTILFISDVHYDTIQDPQLLSDYIDKMNNTNPDIVILGGDIIDERTTNESMHEAFANLSKINSTYGTFFIYGNHDTQPNLNDTENGQRTFTDEDLINTLESNNITILKDNSTVINNDLTLIGRADASFNGQTFRATMNQLLRNVDSNNYLVVLDHQPIEAENNSQLGIDLVLSGHTHGGQVFPYGLASNLTGVLNYGLYHIGNMTQIVSSGYAGWGIPLRNEASCEYVVVHIN